MTYSVIIPSGSEANLAGCLRNLTDMHPDLPHERIIVVADGLSSGVMDVVRDLGITWLDGEKPFVFGRAVNAGASAAEPGSDLMILGDDVRFTVPGTIRRLEHIALDDGVVAVAPSVIGTCGPGPQRHRGEDEPQLVKSLAFIAVYITAWGWASVGKMDESFTGYGSDDTDWCRRANGVGSLLVSHATPVQHLDGRSVYRNRPDIRALADRSRRTYEEKWVG